MVDESIYKKALLIRRTEDAFLELFGKGQLNGTVHTCNGQEFSALAFCPKLKKGDIIFSSHRCHGHYIAHTGDVRGLIAELMGKDSGACGGIGSSQHLYNDGFFSNGVQGGIMPVSAGLALSLKRKKKNAVLNVFIGDGTLGEGVVYETMNLASLLELPLHIVCENNLYAQSTHVSHNLAGAILDRPKAFGIKTYHSNTWDLDALFRNATESLNDARKNRPIFHLVDTYRLNHHSKSDDNRDINEVSIYARKDPLNLFRDSNPELYDEMLFEIDSEISNFINLAEKESEQNPSKYVDELIFQDDIERLPIQKLDSRVVNRINLFFEENMSKNNKIIFIGEDVLSPYGGAFKISKGLSDKFPDNVISTPISEGAITGLANGLALGGYRPYLEIMFGDFVTLTLDQIINHASKFHHMYNKKVNCPIVIRTPMGGGRGYGPTHSQTMDKFIVGIDNVTVVAINSLIDPLIIYQNILDNQKHPCIVIENKIDYGKFVGDVKLDYYSITYSNETFPVVISTPLVDSPTLTIVTYGGISRDLFDAVPEIFLNTGLIPEVIVLSKISPLDVRPIINSVKKTGRLIVIEEGSKNFGIGSEIVSQVVEELGSDSIVAKRIGALPIPIPSSKSLEEYVLPNTTIVEDIKRELML